MKTPVSHCLKLLLLGWLALAPVSAADRGKPNIVIILADDLGYGDLRSYGGDRFNTANLDALARGGVRFTDFHSNGAVCSPTRAALMTGRYQQRTGITGVVTARSHRHTGLDLAETTLAEIARQAGYATALVGKWHLGYQPDYNPIRQGFDEFIGYVSGNVDYHAHLDQTGAEDWWKQDRLHPMEGYTTDLITEYGVDFIRRHRDRPFLLYLAHQAPHFPFQGRRDPPRYTREEGSTKDPLTLPVYTEMIEVMDEGIGRIREAIEEAGLSENTLIFFTSDNGPAGLSTAGQFRGKKGTLYEGGHRVPAIAYWPGRIKAGVVSDEKAMTMDLLPTVAALAGVSISEDLLIDGIDLSGHLLEGTPLPDRLLYWQHNDSLAVRSGDYKLLADRSFEKLELYDLRSDPAESRNLAPERPELAEQLVTELRAWFEAVTKDVAIRSP